MKWGLALIAGLVAAPASAQSGASFDCARASTAIERAICRDARLSSADGHMAAAYKQLIDRLNGAARDELQKDQARWLAGRDQACSDGAVEIAICLKNRIENRLANLRVMADGAFPFISQQTIVKIGKVRNAGFAIDASYPRFDGNSAGFAAANAFFADRAKIAIADHVPSADEFADRAQTWSYDQNFLLHRPGANAIAVATTTYGFTGGAHGYGAVTGALVDLRSGRLLEPSDIFLPGDKWLPALRDRVAADLKKQFVERPGFEDALAPEKLDKLLQEPERYIWRADGLAIVFNQYEVAAYVMGRYVVHVPYGRLAPLMRPDAPIGK
jgi:uncharacterized protein